MILVDEHQCHALRVALVEDQGIYYSVMSAYQAGNRALLWAVYSIGDDCIDMRCYFCMGTYTDIRPRNRDYHAIDKDLNWDLLLQNPASVIMRLIL